MQTLRGEKSFRNVIKLQEEKGVSYILNIGKGKKGAKGDLWPQSGIIDLAGSWGQVRREGGKIGQLREEELTGICFADSVHRSLYTTSLEAFVIYISDRVRGGTSYLFSDVEFRIPSKCKLPSE